MKILCAGLFPALQRTLALESLNPGAVNRIQGVTLSAGGKAVNSARVLKTLGAVPLLFGFSGGDTGAAMEQLLTEDGLAQRFVQTGAPVRLCQTLLAADAPDFTELVEEGPALTPQDWKNLLATFIELLGAGDARLCILSGSLPAHAPQDIYAGMLAAAADRAVSCILDSSGPALASALAQRPALVKINAAELFRTVGGAVPEEDTAAAIEAAAQVLIGRGAEAAGITQGGDNAWLITKTRTSRFRIPSVKVVSSLGCGDAVNAGIAFAQQRGDALESAFAFGLACGVSNAMHRLPGRIDPARIADLATCIRTSA